MRLTAAFATILLALTPAALGSEPSGAWEGTTTITLTSSLSTTLTITKTLAYANATTSSSTLSHQPTGWNATQASATVNKPTLTPAATTFYSASPSIASKTATGAASVQDINLAVAALAGAAAMFWGSL